MKFIIKPTISDHMRLARSWGYKEIFNRHNQTTSYINRTGSNDYPRFHLYLRNLDSGEVEVDLHLDLVRPLHKKVANASEGTGDVVEKEMERIQSTSKPMSIAG